MRGSSDGKPCMRLSKPKVNESNPLEPLLGPVTAVQQLIDAFDQQGIIIGGVAVSLLSQPRLTADADAMLLLSLDDLPQLVEKAQAFGLTPRIPDVIPFARQSRVVLLKHEVSGIHVDISLGLLPFEVEAVERSEEFQAGNLRLRLPTPEDLDYSQSGCASSQRYAGHCRYCCRPSEFRRQSYCILGTTVCRFAGNAGIVG